MSEVQNAEPVCPYCGFVFEVMPTRKRKCPQCKETIYRQSRPPDNIKMLMTESQAAAAKKEWDEYEIQKEEQQLNEALSTIQNPNPPKDKMMAYHWLSVYYWRKGPETHELSFECQKGRGIEQLRSYLPPYRTGISHVKIEFSDQTCGHLKHGPDNGVIYSLKEIFKQLPLPLPHTNPANGICHCTYFPVLSPINAKLK